MPSETPNIDRCIDNYYALPEWQITVIRRAARDELAALREQLKQASNAALDEAAKVVSDEANRWSGSSSVIARELMHVAGLISSLKGS